MLTDTVITLDNDGPTRNVVHLLWLLAHRREQVAHLVEGITWDGYWGAVVKWVASGRPIEELRSLAGPDSPGLRTMEAVLARTELYTEEQAPEGMRIVLALLLRAQEGACSP